MILLLMACGAAPELLPQIPGASVSVETRMSDGSLPLECSARLVAREDPAEARDPPANDQERPCGPDLRWEGLDPGDYLLVVQGRSVASATEPITLAPDQALDLGALSLSPGGTLAVQVFLPSGDPGGLEIRVDGATAGRTDAEGRARLRGVPVGDVEVAVRAGGHAAQAVARVEEGQETALVLEMDPLPQRPVMGLRFRAVAAGAEVTWIHPDGPAAGALVVGDVLTAVEGRSLAGLSSAQAGPLLAGSQVGAIRRFELLRGGAPLALELAPIGAVDLSARTEQE